MYWHLGYNRVGLKGNRNFNICTVHLYYLYNEPTNAQLINNYIALSTILLHLQGARSQYLLSYISM